MDVDVLTLKLSEAQFKKICQMMYRLSGVLLQSGKEELVKSRLAKRLRVLGLSSFGQYVSYLEADRSCTELTTLTDALTTNKTNFFRETAHFNYLSRQILPELRARGEGIRIWSAGCSSGEEPFTIAILMREELSDINRLGVKILATDISTKVLREAREAVYGEDELRDMPALLLQRYFTCVQITRPRSYRVNDNVRSLVRLAQLNLIGEWPMRGPFDVIFCRNVMIYFDRPTRERLVHRYGTLLRPGGHLFVGHSESLVASSSEFKYVQPAVYAKKDGKD